MAQNDTDSNSVAFAIGDLRPIRLIELPPALLQKISDDEESLTFKSTTGTDNGLALLCTRDQTFEVRQMQSSNLLLLSETCKDTVTGEASLRAISEPKGMLELTQKRTDATSWLASVLPSIDLDTTTYEWVTGNKGEKRSRAELEAIAPCSVGEFAAAWKANAAFENAGVAGRPTPLLCKKLWRTIKNVLEDEMNANLTEPMSDSSIMSWTRSGEELDSRSTTAILEHVSLHEGGKTTIQESSLVPWLGTVIIGSSGDDGVSQENLLEEWKNLLPEQWRDGAKLDRIKSECEIMDDGRVKIASGPQEPTAETTKKPASKWHEKLKASRR